MPERFVAAQHFLSFCDVLWGVIMPVMREKNVIVTINSFFLSQQKRELQS